MKPFGWKLLPTVLCLSLNLAFNASAADGQLYSLEDLKVLEREKSAREFLKHAKDVPPSQRERVWQALVINMASYYLQKSIERNEYSEANKNFISDFVSWPVVQADQTILKYARDYFVEFIDLCYSRENKTNQNCYDETLSIWNRIPQNAQFGLQLARMTKTKFPEKSVWNFVKNTTQSDFSEYYCTIPLIKEEVLNLFFHKYQKETNESELAIDIQKHISTNCLTHLLPDLREVAFSQNKSRDIAFFILTSFNGLDQVEEDLFLVRYLLLEPKQGELLNIAWARVLTLSKEPVRRSHVLERLARLDPFPDAVFRHDSLDVSKVVARHLEKNFPEFWPRYFQKCHEFFAGTKKFPRGNPTPSCSQAGKLTEDSYLYSQKVHQILSGRKRVK